jgi:hypothetical protein
MVNNKKIRHYEEDKSPTKQSIRKIGFRQHNSYYKKNHFYGRIRGG